MPPHRFRLNAVIRRIPGEGRDDDDPERPAGRGAFPLLDARAQRALRAVRARLRQRRVRALRAARGDGLRGEPPRLRLGRVRRRPGARRPHRPALRRRQRAGAGRDRHRTALGRRQRGAPPLLRADLLDALLGALPRALRLFRVPRAPRRVDLDPGRAERPRGGRPDAVRRDRAPGTDQGDARRRSRRPPRGSRKRISSRTTSSSSSSTRWRSISTCATRPTGGSRPSPACRGTPRPTPR